MVGKIVLMVGKYLTHIPNNDMVGMETFKQTKKRGIFIMNEIVKYHNDMNEIRLKQFSAMDLDMLMLLCSKVKNRDTDEMVFQFSDLKKSLGILKKSDKDFLDILERMNRKLNNITCHIRTETRRISFTLFPTLDANSETKTLTVAVNEKYAYLLNELSKNFTRFELEEFVKLESKYSKNLYRLLKQYRKTGTYKVDAERFRELMDCPKSYNNKMFMYDCVNVAIKELSQGYFTGLKVEPIRAAKRGRPIVAYEFTFKPSDQIPGQSVIDGAEPDPKKKPRQKRQPDAKNRFNNFDQRAYSSDQIAAIEKAAANRRK